MRGPRGSPPAGRRARRARRNASSAPRWRARWRRRRHRGRAAGRRARTSRRRRCSRWRRARYAIPTSAALAGYAFAWAEATTSAAVRLVPLGQSAGQRLLAAAGDAIPAVVARARALDDDELAATAPGQAIASALHEALYSRLFRIMRTADANTPCASASPGPSARARPRWSTRSASGCATGTTSPW